MSLWEYKAITSGKGGFATPALLESYLNQLGTDEWEIIEFRTQPENILAFSGLARRPTQRDWTLEAAVAAAARVEADKLRAEFAAKFQGASSSSPASATPSKDDSGNPNRDDSFRRPRDTDSDQDPYALDDSSVEAEEIPAEDELPTFFEAVRPHMRRNQKGPGYSVGLEYIIKKFEMIEEDLLSALVEIGFEIPEDEDDKPVYIEYDGDIYWLNVNRRGEVWINTREKPRAVFKTVKATRLSPEEAQPEQPETSESQTHGREEREGRGDSRDNRRNDNRNRRNEQRSEQRNEQRNESRNESRTAPQAEASASPETPVSTDAAAEASTAQGAEATGETPVAQPKPQREPATAAPLPTGLDLLERVRPMMRRSRGGWSGTISYLSRALRHSDEELVAAFASIGLIAPAASGDKAPIIECGPFAFWLNKDGRGGIWINAREARRMRQEQKAQASAEVPAAEGLASTVSEPGPIADLAAEAPTAEAPEGLVPGQTHPADAATPSLSPSDEPAIACAIQPLEEPAPSIEKPSNEALSSSIAAPVSIEQATILPLVDQAASLEQLPPQAQGNVSPSNDREAQPVETAIATDEPSPGASQAPLSAFTQPLADLRPFMKELRPGSFAGELCFLADKFSRNPETLLELLVGTGLKSPDKPSKKPVFVEYAGEVYWLNRNAKGELWLNAKASKFSRKDEDSELEEPLDAAVESEASIEEKKPRRVARPRKKAD